MYNSCILISFVILQYFNFEEIQLGIVRKSLLHKRKVDLKKIKKDFEFFCKENPQEIRLIQLALI